MNGWSKNVEEQQAIGAAALEKHLTRNPDSLSMLGLKADLFALRARYEESLLIADSVLKRAPEHSEALATRAYDLLKLGRPLEALTAVNELLERGLEETLSLAAAVHYRLAHFELAAQHQKPEGPAAPTPRDASARAAPGPRAVNFADNQWPPTVWSPKRPPPYLRSSHPLFAESRNY